MTESTFITPKVFCETRGERFRLLLRCHRNWKKSPTRSQLEWKKSTINCEIFNALIQFAIYRGKMILGKDGVFWVYLRYETREVIVVFDDEHPCYKWHRRKCFQRGSQPYQLLSAEDKAASSSDRSMCLGHQYHR